MELNSTEFLKWIKDEMKSQNEVTLRYKDFSFVMQPSGNNIEIYSRGKILADYNSFDEFLNNFSIQGRLFTDIIDDIEFDD